MSYKAMPHPTTYNILYKKDSYSGVWHDVAIGFGHTDSKWFNFEKQFKAKLGLIIFSSSILRNASVYFTTTSSMREIFCMIEGRKIFIYHILLKIFHMLKKSSFIMHFFLVEYYYGMECSMKQFSSEAFKIIWCRYGLLYAKINIGIVVIQ